jgi:predicted cation transporter
MGITSKEWARLGLPIGIAAMAVYFAVIFGASYLGLA